jgi:tetratricopeptide (TPR) repeat protein
MKSRWNRIRTSFRFVGPAIALLTLAICSPVVNAQMGGIGFLDNTPGSEFDDALYNFDQTVKDAYEAGEAATVQVQQFMREQKTEEAGKKIGEAVGKFTECIETARVNNNERNLWSPYFMRAQLYSMSGAFDRAISDLLLVTSRNPQFADAHFALGNAYLAMEERGAAIDAFSRAINVGRTSPALPAFHYARGTAYADIENHEAAAEDFLRVNTLRPGVPDTYYRAGSALANLGQQRRLEGDLSASDQLASAIAMLDKAIRLQEMVNARSPETSDRGFPEAYFDRGRARLDLGELDDAIDDFQTSVKQDPENLTYADQLVRALMGRASQLEVGAINEEARNEIESEIRDDYQESIKALDALIAKEKELAEEAEAAIAEAKAAAAEAREAATDDEEETDEPADDLTFPGDDTPDADATEPETEATPTDDAATEPDGDAAEAPDVDPFGTDDDLGGLFDDPADEDESADADEPAADDSPDGPGADDLTPGSDLTPSDDTGTSPEAAPMPAPLPPEPYKPVVEPAEAYVLRSAAKIGLARYMPGEDAATLYRDAIDDCNRALEEDPALPGAYYNRGLAERMIGDFDDALWSFNEALKLQPVFGEARFRRGIVWFYLDEFDVALADFLEVANSGQDPRAFFWAGFVQALRGEHSDAVRSYSEALRLNPNHTLAYNNRGLSYLHLERYDRALNDLNEVIRRDRQNAEAYLYRGAAEQRLEMPDRAERSFKAALRYDPELADAHKRLIDLYRERGDDESAQEQISKLNQLEEEVEAPDAG